MDDWSPLRSIDDKLLARKHKPRTRLLLIGCAFLAAMAIAISATSP